MRNEYPSDGIVRMVKKINSVGVGRTKKYYLKKHRRSNFDRILLMVRSAAQLGYAKTGRKFGVSRQMVERTLIEVYKCATEAEKEGLLS